MSAITSIVGKIVSEVVRRELREAKSQPSVRLQDFTRDEITVIARELQGFQVRSASEAVRVVVATNRPWAGLPEECVLRDGETLTWHRNNNRSGLVLVEADPQGDAQGLRNMYTLTDRTVVDSTMASEVGFANVVRAAWNCRSSGAVDEPPGALGIALREVFDAVTGLAPKSLRSWVAYFDSVCSTLTNGSSARDAVEIGREVGDAFPRLEMFRDPQLGSVLGQERRRRIVRNCHLARLRNPMGRDATEDDISRRIEVTAFCFEDGSKMPDADAEQVRSAMRAIVDPARSRDYASTTYALWSQLFDSPSELGLGAQVKRELEKRAPALVPEFEGLDVEVGLDQEDPEAAEQTLKSPVVKKLPRPLVRRLEKLALGTVRTANDPLRELLACFEKLSPAREGIERRTVELVVEGTEDGAAGRQLFGWLWGRSLGEIAMASRDGLGTILELRGVPTGAVEFPQPTSARDDAGDEDDDDTEEEDDSPWAPVRVVLREREGAGQWRTFARFEWRPEEHPALAAMARWMAEEDPTRARVTDATLDRWCLGALEKEGLVGERPVPAPADGPTEKWARGRREYFARASAEGLSIEGLEAYVVHWSELLEAVRTDHAPQGAPNQELNAFLLVDSVSLGGGRVALSATHPIRLRWLARYLRYMSDRIRSTLDRGLLVNEVNSDFLFDHLDQLSPHRQPPFVCLDGSTLAISARELDGFEEFAAIRRERAPAKDWVSELDDAAVDEIATVARGYLENHPHKRDGLSLVVFLRDGATRVVERLVTRIRSRDFAEVGLDVHVFAPPIHHFVITEALARFDSEEERSATFLPAVRTIVHYWNDPDEAPDLGPVADGVDLAIVPNLFGTNAYAQEKTRADISNGSFDPILDAAEHVERTAIGVNENVSRVLLPELSDPILESWSTLNVWRLRNEPVATGGGRQTDYVSLQVRFDRGRAFFMALHERAHWVITLDPFIGRDQVEALENRPDVITVRPGIGKNETYTLVVSSSSGKEFVVGKLARRLSTDLGLCDEATAPEMATRLYAMARHLAPGVILRALGLGSTVQEIIGLLVARRVLEEGDPAPAGARFEAWISLDEHTDWFGGPQNPRADLLRVRGGRDRGELVLELDVLEAKFREHGDVGRAEEQVERTIRLCKEAFQLEPRRDDAEFWRRELLRAIEQGCKRHEEGDPYHAFVAWEASGDRRPHMNEEDRKDLRDGTYRLGAVRGTIVGIAWGSSSFTQTELVLGGGTRLLRLGAERLRAVLNDLKSGVAVRRPSAPPPAAESAPSDGPAAPEAAASPVDRVVVSTPRSASGEPPRIRGLGPEGMVRRYQSVLDALSEFGVRVKRVENEPTAEGPGFYVVRVDPDRGVTADVVMGKTRELKLRLQLREDQTPRAYIDRGAVVFEVPKRDEERYLVTTEEVWAKATWPRDALYAPIGEDVRGQVVGVEFSSPDTPHLLIAGTTGSGKSVALETILRGMCHVHGPDELQLVLVDPKGTELVDFESDSHLRGTIGMDAEDAKRALEEAVSEMQRRYELLKARRVRTIVEYNRTGPAEKLPWVVVVLDEYADLTADKDDRKQIEDSLRRLAQKARASGIHVILATQKPSAEILSTSVRSNLPVQLALRVKTATDSRIVMDEGGAETLSGKGDALLKTAKGVVRVQCALWKRGAGGA